MRVVEANGVQLHVTERGTGTPVVFVHMGGADLRYWGAQLPEFADRGYRAIAYSRRFAWPNDNPMVGDYSPRVDADDLEALLGAIDAAPAHVVAGSIGAFAALLLALRRPEVVRSLVLAEPPIVPWALASEEGAAVARHFERDVWQPTRAAFLEGDAEQAMARLLDHFVEPGALAAFPDRTRRRIMENARDWEAHTRSSVPFPDLDPDDVRRLAVPVLMLSGERTLPLHRIVDARLERLLPDVTRVIVPEATHDLWAERGEFCRAWTLEFLERVAGRHVGGYSRA